MNTCNILLYMYINYGVELLNFQEKIGSITRKKWKDIQWTIKLVNFMAFLWYFRAPEVKVWQ